jgi:hypothetical protein
VGATLPVGSTAKSGSGQNDGEDSMPAILPVTNTPVTNTPVTNTRIGNPCVDRPDIPRIAP